MLSALIHILENLKREKYHLTRHLSFLLCFLHSWSSKFPSGNIFLQRKLPLAISLRANIPAVNSFVFLHLRIPLFYPHPWRMFSLHIEFCVGYFFQPCKDFTPPLLWILTRNPLYSLASVVFDYYPPTHNVSFCYGCFQDLIFGF